MRRENGAGAGILWRTGAVTLGQIDKVDPESYLSAGSPGAGAGAPSGDSTMLGALARKIFGSSNDRRLKTYAPKVAAINALEAEVAALSDEALRARTQEFRDQIAAGRTLDELLAPAFATVREAARRTLGQRHFDVQLIGGMVLHEGAISEMRTGEGKTLVATLAAYLNALKLLQKLLLMQ